MHGARLIIEELSESPEPKAPTLSFDTANAWVAAARKRWQRHVKAAFSRSPSNSDFIPERGKPADIDLLKVACEPRELSLDVTSVTAPTPVEAEPPPLWSSDSHGRVFSPTAPWFDLKSVKPFSGMLGTPLSVLVQPPPTCGKRGGNVSFSVALLLMLQLMTTACFDESFHAPLPAPFNSLPPIPGADVTDADFTKYAADHPMPSRRPPKPDPNLVISDPTDLPTVLPDPYICGQPVLVMARGSLVAAVVVQAHNMSESKIFYSVSLGDGTQEFYPPEHVVVLPLDPEFVASLDPTPPLKRRRTVDAPSFLNAVETDSMPPSVDESSPVAEPAVVDGIPAVPAPCCARTDFTETPFCFCRAWLHSNSFC